jgi:hypothetical protein
VGFVSALVFSGLVFLGIRSYHAWKGWRANKRVLDAVNDLEGFLQERIRRHRDFVKELCWVSQLKGFRYQVNRVRNRMIRIMGCLGPPPAQRLKAKHGTSQPRHETLFFRYVFETGDLETEYRRFKNGIDSSSYYKSYTSKWAQSLVQGVLKSLFVPSRRSRFEAVFDDVSRTIRSDLDAISGGNDLMLLMTDKRLTEELNLEIPKIAECPQGMFLDASRGGHMDVVSRHVFMTQGNVFTHIPISNVNFKTGTSRFDIQADAPEAIIGHFALNIPSKDFRPKARKV